ncbi:NUDIX hydrolase [Brevibacillus daliensis]|uniref:NUDIX hydrolase n=1 Tax=Brevibacillus daliensis TaxID=2892995 RepID=UPI001E5C70C6|nr:CoA pyrophosphatase [Brevibacillus daliensis]
MDNLLEHAVQNLADRQRGILDQEKYVRTAVLLPIIRDKEGDWAILFEKRASTLRNQAGEICFPGGHVEPQDQSEWETAKRETIEELGVEAEMIKYVADLDILVNAHDLLVYPYAAFLSIDQGIVPDRNEVDEVFSVKLAKLISMEPITYDMQIRVEPEDNFPFHLIANGRNYKWKNGKRNTHFYEVDGKVIWGITAQILKHFLELLKQDPELCQKLGN